MVTPEQLKKIEEIKKEHGLLCGDDFLALTNNDMELYNAYVPYWDAIIMPSILEKIQTRIDELS